MERLFNIAGIHLCEDIIIYAALEKESVRKNPEISLCILADVGYASAFQMRSVMMTQMQSVETVQSVLSSDPDISVLFFINAVYGGIQSFIVRYAGEDILFFCFGNAAYEKYQ